MSDLSEAVTALTEPTIEHIAQLGDDGKWVRTHTVEHAPLLRQLADAVKPASTVTGPGTPSMPSERSPIDLTLLLEFSKIASEIRSWCHKHHVIADPNRLLDSNSFMTSVQGLDPSDGAGITSAIQAAIAANPILKAVQAAAASGTELGGSQEAGLITDEQLARMSPEQIDKALREGKLKHLL